MKLQHATLRQKLTLVTLVCSAAALITAAVALGTYEWLFYRRSIYAQLTTMSAMAARNCTAALAFSNEDDASRILSELKIVAWPRKCDTNSLAAPAPRTSQSGACST